MSVSNECAASKYILECILLLTNISVLFAALANRVTLLGNLQSAQNFVQRCHISFNIVNYLIHIDSSMPDVQIVKKTQ